MPRSTSSGSWATLADSTSTMPSIVEGIALEAPGGSPTYYYATKAMTFRMQSYSPRLRKVSALASSLNQGLQRATVTITNADLNESQLIVSPSPESYVGWLIRVFKLIIAEDLLSEGYAYPFIGRVVGFRLDENVLELDAVTSINRSPTLSNRRVSVKCPWEFKGTECGYVGVETVCNKLYDDAGGCSGRSNQFRFGGFPTRPAEAAIKAITDKGKPPAYQLVQLDTTYQSQRTTLRFDDTFDVTDDPGTNATVITSLATGSAAETPDWIDVTSSTYKASGSATTTTGDITSATDSLVVASATSFAIGQGIRVAGAGVASADLVTTISVIAGTTFTLADNASTTVVGAVVSHDDTTAIQAAIDAAEAGTIKTVFIPAGTYRVSGLTASGNVSILGSGDKATILNSAINAVILDCAADASFELPKISSLKIVGSTSAGSSQIGLKMDDGTYGLRGVVRDVWIEDCGGNGLYVGKAFSSIFENIFIDDCEGYPLLYNADAMPGNVFRSIYVGVLRAAAPTGFRIKAGDFVGHNLNGINNALDPSRWMVVGRKNGVDGDVVDAGATVRLYDSNLESWVTHGVYLYASSNISLFNCYFAGDASGNGAKKPIEFEHIGDGSSYYAQYIQRGFISDTCTFADGPLTNYANDQAIHCNGFPPIETLGQGPRVASGDPLSTYYNSSTSATARLSRIDHNLNKVTITATTSYTQPGIRYIECNHTGAGITVSLPWAGYYKQGEMVVIKDISSPGAGTYNVTINSNGGGSVNGGSFTLNVTGQSIILVPDGSSDWRVIGSHFTSGDSGIRVVDVTTYGARGDDSTDNTSAIQSAIAAAIALSKPLYFPPGTYRTDNLFIGGKNSLIILGAGPGRSILKSRTSAYSIIDIDADTATAHSIAIENLGFYGYGSGANNDGIEIRNSGGYQSFNLTLRNLRFENCGNSAIRSDDGAFTMLLDGIDASMPAGASNAIDLWGSNDTTLIRCYVHSVATGKAAYRIRAGSPTLIGCNGIDSGTTASWGVFGNKTSEDGLDSYCRVTLIGCNVESFTDYGVRCKDGSYASFFNTQLIAPASGTVTPIKFDYVTENQAGIFDAQSGIQTQGASYTSGYAVHSDGMPFMQIGHREFTSYYDTAGAAAATFPGITGTRITGTQDYATTLNGHTKIAGHVSMNEQSAPGAAPSNTGFLYAKDDGGATALYWKADGVAERRIDTPNSIGLTSTRIGFGDGSNLLTSSANLTYNDTDKTLSVTKAGGNPHVLVTDSTNSITVRAGTLAGAPDRGIVGTMTNQPFVLYQNGTEGWGLDTSRHLRPYESNDGQDVGVSTARARTVYVGTSVDVGLSSSKTGEIILRNASNANTLKLKAGATSTDTTLTLPTDDGTSGQFLKTDGSGVLSWDAPAAGANAALSNLASVAVNTSLLPGADNAHDLGSASFSWRDAHIERDALIGRQIQSSGSALSYAAGTGAGTTPSITIDGNAIAGAILLTTGTTPATSSQIVQMTMAAAFTTYPVVIITPGNAAAAALTGNKQVFVDDAAMLTNKWSLKSGSTALDAATDYVWYFHVIGI